MRIIMTTRNNNIVPTTGSYLPYRLARRAFDPFGYGFGLGFPTFDGLLGGDFDKRLRDFTGSLTSDVKETADGYEVKVDIPGVDKKDIDVQFDGDTHVLSVSYCHEDAASDGSDEDAKDADKWLVRERNYVSGSRSFELEKGTKEGIHAKYADGVLTVDVPKSKDEKKDTPSVEVE